MNPYAKVLASLMRVIAVGMILLAAVSLFLDYLRSRTGREEVRSDGWPVAWLVLGLGVVLWMGSGPWARRWTRHWDE
ncbi:MAG: hypothetical protein RMN51_09410 [Verrucomicrobiota bacterium]|nr:hypothetical protein [Limisphaera sp.]MDW8382309.1 hypothetical protein [Verrucomicrobiota bacterium]